MRLFTFFSAMLIFALAPDPAYAAKIHKWIDDQGNVHYGRKPPPGTSSSVVKTQRSHISEDAAKEQLKRLSEKSAERNENRRLLKRSEDEDAANTARRKDNCEIAKKNLAVLHKPDKVQAKGSDGQPFYLSDEAKQKKIEQSNRQIKEFCG